MSTGGLIGSMLLGGMAGYGQAGLEAAQKEKEMAREEGLKRLDAELNMDNLEFQANRADARSLADREATATENKANREHEYNLLDAKLKAENKDSSELQVLKWLQGEGLLGEYLKSKGTAKAGKDGNLTQAEKAKMYNDYITKHDPMDGEPMTRSDWEKSVLGASSNGAGGGGGVTLSSTTIDQLADRLRKTPFSQERLALKELVTEVGEDNAVAVIDKVKSKKEAETMKQVATSNSFKQPEPVSFFRSYSLPSPADRLEQSSRLGMK